VGWDTEIDEEFLARTRARAAALRIIFAFSAARQLLSLFCSVFPSGGVLLLN
jgi:hypothetical protein